LYYFVQILFYTYIYNFTLHTHTHTHTHTYISFLHFEMNNLCADIKGIFKRQFKNGN